MDYIPPEAFVVLAGVAAVLGLIAVCMGLFGPKEKEKRKK